MAANPKINAIKVSAKRDKNDPIGKKKGDGGPWEILKIEVRSDRDHFNSLRGYSSIPVQSQMAYSSILR